MPDLILLTALFVHVFRYCIKAKAKPSVQDNIDMTDFYDDDYDLDDDYDDYDEEEDDEAADDTDDSGTGKVYIRVVLKLGLICLILRKYPRLLFMLGKSILKIISRTKGLSISYSLTN